MRVGVVMPTFNQARWLPSALASCFAQRTSVEMDLCVVDDGSTDATKSILEVHSPVLRVITHHKNKGTAEAINTGIEVISDGCDALTWISSDNTMSVDWLEKLSGPLTDPKVGVAYGGFWYVVPNRTQYHFTPYQKNHLINDLNCYFGPAFLIRRDVWLGAGPHRGRISHDYDHWLRVEEVCLQLGLLIVGVDHPLCWYNAHDQRVTITRHHEYDADRWQAEARKRRGV